MCGTWVGDFSPAAMNGFDEIPTKIQFVNNKVESLIQTLHSAVQSAVVRNSADRADMSFRKTNP